MVETKLLTCTLGPHRAIVLSDKPPNIMELINKGNEIPPVSDLDTVKVLFSYPTDCLELCITVDRDNGIVEQDLYFFFFL